MIWFSVHIELKPIFMCISSRIELCFYFDVFWTGRTLIEFCIFRFIWEESEQIGNVIKIRKIFSPTH